VPAVRIVEVSATTTFPLKKARRSDAEYLP